MLLYEKKDGTARISLNRPEVHHALHPELISAITASLYDAWHDEEIRVVLLTAEGSAAFCSGADIKAFASSGRGVGQTLEDYYNPMVMAIREIPKPVICRLNGLAVGAGASLALSCDTVVAADDAYFAFLFVHLGLMPDAGAHWILPRLVGMARTFELITTGRKLHAPEAHAIGLISHVIPRQKLDEKVEELLQYYGHAPTLAIAAMKRMLNEAFTSDIKSILRKEVIEQQQLSETIDFQIGTQAFLDKTKPLFQGQ